MLACLLDKPSSIFKSRDITLLKMFSIIKAMIFLVVMYGCDSWSIKNGEKWSIEGFELWCWTRILSVPWTTRRSNKSMLKEINLKYSLEGLMLKLKLQYFGQLMWRNYSLEKPYYWERLKAGGEEDDRGWDGWIASPTWWYEFEQFPGIGEGQRSLACCSPWGCKESDMTEWLNWTELNIPHSKCYL